MTRKYRTIFILSLAAALFVLISVWQNSQVVRVAESEALTSIEGIAVNPETQSDRIDFSETGSPVQVAFKKSSPTAVHKSSQGNAGKQSHDARQYAADNNSEKAEYGLSQSEKKAKFSLPSWEKIFSSDGRFVDEFGRNGSIGRNGVPDFVDLYGGVHATFNEEIISNGVAVDISALLNHEELDEQVLYNGPVNPTHDLGYSWFLATRQPEGGLRLYTAVERLSHPGDTFIEFEFNQVGVRLGSGTPWWRLMGERTSGDVLVRMNFKNGRLNSVEVAEWQFGKFEVLQDLPGLGHRGCFERSFIIYCTGPQRLARPPQEVWNESFQRVASTEPDELIELGIDVRKLAMTNIEISGLVIRTPQDIVLNTFRSPRGRFSLNNGRIDFENFN